MLNLMNIGTLFQIHHYKYDYTSNVLLGIVLYLPENEVKRWAFSLHSTPHHTQGPSPCCLINASQRSVHTNLTLPSKVIESETSRKVPTSVGRAPFVNSM